MFSETGTSCISFGSVRKPWSKMLFVVSNSVFWAKFLPIFRVVNNKSVRNEFPFSNIMKV